VLHYVHAKHGVDKRLVPLVCGCGVCVLGVIVCAVCGFLGLCVGYDRVYVYLLWSRRYWK